MGKQEPKKASFYNPPATVPLEPLSDHPQPIASLDSLFEPPSDDEWLGVMPNVGEPFAPVTKPAELPEVPEVPLVVLDAVQAKILGEITPSHFFITGPAGTGKSVLAGQIIAKLRALGRRVNITASTGIAAIHVGGTTIHSFLGTNICGSIAEAERNQRDLNRNAEFRLRSTDVIVVDEVSMLTGDYIDMMDWRLRTVCHSKLPFGGKQILFFGDFLQLPPVIKDPRKVERHFAFQAKAWETANVQTRVLTINHRQGDDAEFSRHLDLMRVGKFDTATAQYFRQCLDRRLRQPIILYPTNVAVDAVNQAKLAKVPGSVEQFPANVRGDSRACEMLVRNCIADVFLKLKVGAQVLVIKNSVGGNEYRNGERGTLTKIEPDCLHVHLETEGHERDVTLERATWEWRNAEQRILASLVQFPLKLGYAITIHKSQGMTLERMRCDLRRCFAPGQAYVAVSRAKNAKHLSLESPLQATQVFVDKTCAEFYARSRPKARRIG